MGSHDPEALMRLFAKLAARQLKQEDFSAWAMIARDERMRGFEGGYGPNGEPWKPLKAATIERKSGTHKTSRFRKSKGGIYASRAKRSANPGSPLIDTGQLMKGTVGADSKRGYVRLAQSRSTPVSGSASISTIHDKGMGSNPKRPHWGIYAEARKRIVAEFNKKISDLLKSMGF